MASRAHQFAAERQPFGSTNLVCERPLEPIRRHYGKAAKGLAANITSRSPVSQAPPSWLRICVS